MASVKLPTPDELKAVGRQLGMTLSDDDVKFFLETMGGNIAAYHAIEAMVDPMPPVKYPRTPGYRPQGAENKYNAWYYKSEVQGAPSGKLKGKRIALKDNVCLAGVPMMNGASSLEGYVPDVDRMMMSGIGCNPKTSTRIKLVVKATGKCFPAAGRVFSGGRTLASPRKMLIVPSVTMKGCSARLTMRPPLIAPQINPMTSGTKIATGKTTITEEFSGNACKAAAPPSAESAMIDPTERSIPAVRITKVIPIAIRPSIETWRITLNRYRSGPPVMK